MDWVSVSWIWVIVVVVFINDAVEQFSKRTFLLVLLLIVELLLQLLVIHTLVVKSHRNRSHAGQKDIICLVPHNTCFFGYSIYCLIINGLVLNFGRHIKLTPHSPLNLLLALDLHNIIFNVLIWVRIDHFQTWVTVRDVPAAPRRDIRISIKILLRRSGI